MSKRKSNLFFLGKTSTVISFCCFLFTYHDGSCFLSQPVYLTLLYLPRFFSCFFSLCRKLNYLQIVCDCFFSSFFVAVLFVVVIFCLSLLNALKNKTRSLLNQAEVHCHNSRLLDLSYLIK